MRGYGLVLCLLVSACASNAPGYVSGSQMKNGWSADDKILYAGETYLRPRTAQCSGSRVLHCSGDQSDAHCRCMFTDDVNARTGQMFGMRERGNNGVRQRHRRRN